MAMRNAEDYGNSARVAMKVAGQFFGNRKPKAKTVQNAQSIARGLIP